LEINVFFLIIVWIWGGKLIILPAFFFFLIKIINLNFLEIARQATSKTSIEASTASRMQTVQLCGSPEEEKGTIGQKV
jgi:hypothetical protein